MPCWSGVITHAPSRAGGRPAGEPSSVWPLTNPAAHFKAGEAHGHAASPAAIRPADALTAVGADVIHVLVREIPIERVIVQLVLVEVTAHHSLSCVVGGTSGGAAFCSG